MLALRPDIGPAVGLGHIRRCLALWRAARDWAECHLLADGPVPDAVADAFPDAFPVVSTPATVQGARDACRALRADVLVIDSYQLDRRDVASLREDVRSLVVLDDSGCWPVPGDLVVNAAAGLAPPPDGDAARYLLGPRYAVLAPEFAEPPAGRARDSLERILLTLGGATLPALMAVLARAARAAAAESMLDVVVGPVGAGVGAVRAALVDVAGVRLHESPVSLRPLMLAADLAVSAGGVTLLELAATATPAVGVCLADNQRRNLDGLAAAGALVLAGRHDDPHLPERVRTALSSLVADSAARMALGHRARGLVDGRGACRIAEAIRRQVGASPPVAGEPQAPARASAEGRR